MCSVCKHRETPGILMSCSGKGCKNWYHNSCLDPPLEYVSLGIWLCTLCTKKRLQFGEYSVSDGIESLWDVKDGAQNCKQYFVKYKNLAHVHNRWVPESDIIRCNPEDHDLITKFCKMNQKEKTIRWKQEWTEPQRLLKKRSLMPQKEAEDFFDSLGDKFTYCNVEWLVKWKDLGYEHATWELETSSFLCSTESKNLKRNYENRHEAAKRGFDPAKINKVKQNQFQKLQRLPDGCPPGLDKDHLGSLNQLREFWHNSNGAIFVDDQERVIKTILFAMSILPDVCRPLLIVSTSVSLSLWEAKFNRLAPSINVVVYNGEKDVRKQIRDLEFYEDGSVMFQVLLSHPDAILEDIETMECIGWEAVMVDNCQSSRVSKCLEQLKQLSTNFRMVLLSSPLKESIPEYINLLSFLNPEGNDISSSSNGDSTDTGGVLAMLKAKFAHHIAFERKADSLKFLEYWVPVRLSQVQLEMYCYTLLSNSPALRSHSRTDSVGVLRDILVSLRKCCDHPYMVDQSLQNSLTKGHPVTDILDIGVRASGKLLLLDKMLQEIKNQGRRVLIVSQSGHSGGVGGNPMGDILDDFVRQRFGFESYERKKLMEQELKRIKTGEVLDSSPKVLPVKYKDAALPKNSATSSSHQKSVDDTWQELGAENLEGTQRGLHSQLKPEMSKLYELLELPENVKFLCEELLDYILKNHKVSQEQTGILHAFNIALCWRAASLLKHKVNHRESLSLAVKNLNYECNEGLAEVVYEKLRILKKKFSRRASEISKHSQFTPGNNTPPYVQETSTKLRSDESIPKLCNILKQQQSTACTNELQLKEKFLQEAKSAQLDHTFDQCIPLPDSNFAMEEFSHFKEIVDKFPVVASTSAHCQQSLASTMEISLVQSVIPSEVVNSEAVRPVEVPIYTERRTISEVVLSDNRIHNSSDGIDSQGGPPLAVQHLLCSNPAIDNSNNWESSVGDHRSEHFGDVAVEVNANNRDTALTDPPHSEPPTADALPNRTALPMSREVEAQTNLVIQSAQQNVVSGQLLQENDREYLSVTTSAHPLQPEIRASSPVSNILLDRTHPDQSQQSHQPEAASSSMDPAQLFPVASLMFNHPPVGNEPLINELHRLQLHMDSLNKMYELKKSQLKMECSQEIEKIKQKYDLLHKEQDSLHLQHRKTLDDLCGKVILNQSLADDFRAKFVSTSAAQARAICPPIRPTTGVSQQISTRPSVAGATGVSQQISTRPSVSQQIPTRPSVSQQIPTRPSVAGATGVSQQISTRPSVSQQIPTRPSVSQQIPTRPPVAGATGVSQQISTRPSVSQQIPTRPSVAGATGVSQQISTRPSVSQQIPTRPSVAGATGVSQQISTRPSVSQQIPTRPSVVAGVTAKPVGSSSSGRPSLPRHVAQPSQVDQLSSLEVCHSSSSSQVVRPPLSIPGSVVRATSTPFSRTPSAYGNYGVRSELARAPAPHLQFRLPRTHPTAPANQQQLPTRLGEHIFNATVDSKPSKRKTEFSELIIFKRSLGNLGTKVTSVVIGAIKCSSDFPNPECSFTIDSAVNSMHAHVRYAAAGGGFGFSVAGCMAYIKSWVEQ
ncbi:hypothetical protein GUJ93_ZPchr0012g19846 [Zizania palustris]|nr:hypothetical protein GUJ93_ZPchr0012g19846 [Zizania palustris]